MGESLNLFDVYSKRHTDFSSIDSLMSFYDKYIDYWNSRAQNTENIELKRKCKDIANTLGEVKASQIELFKMDSLLNSNYYIHPIKAQARADFEEWKEKVIFEATTGKEYKKERGRIIEMYPHV